jgi:hypothetical protein
MELENVEIESGITIPDRQTPRTGAYTLAKRMEVGQSVLLPKKHYTSVYNALRKLGHKPSMRVVDEEHVRVWRMA